MSETEEPIFTTPPSDAVVLGSNSHQNHSGNMTLQAEIVARFWEYDGAGDVTKASIVKELAEKYRFVQYAKDNKFHKCDMTKESDSKIVIQLVRKRFNNKRSEMKKPEKWLEKEIAKRSLEYKQASPEGQAKITSDLAQAVMEKFGLPFRIYNNKTQKWMQYENFAQICAKVIELFGECTTSESTKRNAVDTGRGPLLFDNAALEYLEDLTPSTPEKQDLLQRLVGPKGNELATMLTQILDLTEQYDNPEDFYYADSTKKELMSLARCKQNKRLRRQTEGPVPHASQDEDGKSRAQTRKTGEQTNMDSLLSGLASLNFNNEKYVDKLDIVVARQFDDGGKHYYGTMLGDPGLPHGLGFMIYAKTKKWVWGNWRRGKLHGLGGVIYENNHRCFGLFFKDKLHGKAMYLVPGKYRYIGQYRNHKKHGFGLLIHEEKGTYYGNFKNGKFEGIGIHTDLLGVETKGEFENWKCVKPNPYLVLKAP